jgi:hypothetical protein
MPFINQSIINGRRGGGRWSGENLGLETHRLIVKSLLIGRKTTAGKADCCSTARGVNASARDPQDVGVRHKHRGAPCFESVNESYRFYGFIVRRIFWEFLLRPSYGFHFGGRFE